MNEILYQFALGKYPDLTPHEFGEAARAVVKRMPQDGMASVGEMSVLIDREIQDRRRNAATKFDDYSIRERA